MHCLKHAHVPLSVLGAATGKYDGRLDEADIGVGLNQAPDHKVLWAAVCYRLHWTNGNVGVKNKKNTRISLSGA